MVFIKKKISGSIDSSTVRTNSGKSEKSTKKKEK